MNLKDIPLGWIIGIYAFASVALIVAFMGIGSLIH
jgi:hypothetical protein